MSDLQKTANSPKIRRYATTEHLKPYQWAKGTSGNPSGRPKRDFAAEVARAAIEQNPDLVYKGLVGKLKRGDSKTFTACAERGYGKLPQAHEHTGESGQPIKVIVEHIGALLNVTTQ